MALDTGIEWADHTANFWEGCTQISPACDHCYAKTRAERYGTVEWNGPPRRVAAGAKVVRAAQRIAAETGVKQFVFVNSLSDFFDNQADPQWRLEALDAMRAAPDCIFLLLTKRIGNVEDMMRATGIDWERNLPHVWQGITVVNQPEADRDILKLIAAKLALRIPRVFLSIEPMLGAITIAGWMHGCAKCGTHHPATRLDGCTFVKSPGIDWVICGGESGKHARPMHPDWARSLRDQCAAAGVPFMFKQWGDWVPGGHPAALALGDFTMANAMKLATKGGQFPDGQSVWQVGKHAAGRLLDGVEHNGRPQP